MSLDNDDEKLAFRARDRASVLANKWFEKRTADSDATDLAYAAWLDGYEAGKRDEYVKSNTRQTKEET